MTSSPRLRGGKLRFILILGALTAFAPLSIDMYLPAFPAIERGLGASTGAVQVTLSLFFVGLAVGQAFYGPLADWIGRRRPLIAGIVVYIAASVVAALAPDIVTLAAARLVQALGGCAGVVIARAMVADLFDERQSARVFSHLILVMGLAPILAPLIGGQILLLFDWPAIFWLLAGFGGLCLVAVGYGLGETLPAERRLEHGIGGALRGYLELAADRRFMGLAGTSALVFAGMFAYITGSPFVFIELFGMSPQSYGLLFGLNALGLISASQINTLLLRRFEGRQILLAAVLAHAVAGLVLAGVALAGTGGLPAFAAPLFVAVASLGFIGPNSMAAAMARARSRAGAGSALIGVLQFAIGAVASVAVGLLHDGTAVPMSAVIAVLGVSGLLAYRLAASIRAR